MALNTLRGNGCATPIFYIEGMFAVFTRIEQETYQPNGRKARAAILS